MASAISHLRARCLAASVAVVPVSGWTIAPRDANGNFEWWGSPYVIVASGVALAVVAMKSARWTTNLPLAIAALGWLIVVGALAFDDLLNDGMGGIGDGFIALVGLVVVGIATSVAALTPFKKSVGTVRLRR